VITNEIIYMNFTGLILLGLLAGLTAISTYEATNFLIRKYRESKNRRT
jgi:hypothetical protein